MKKLSKRAIASRANGKLSHGPVTSAGKLRASANSTRHGLLADNLVLDDESKEVFALLHQQYIDRINPTDGIEIGLVEELAATAWRQRRLLAIETSLFNQAAAKRTEEDFVVCLAGVFSELSRGPELALIDRYESRLHRMFQRTLKNIQLLREIEHTEPSTGELTQLPADPEIPELPNEPRSEQPPTPVSDPDNLTQGVAELSMLPTGPQVPPPHTSTEISELPNEPRSEQPPAESAVYAPTLIRKSDPPPAPPRNLYEGYPRFEYDPATGRLKRVA
jgi:hypothetical protein